MNLISFEEFIQQDPIYRFFIREAKYSNDKEGMFSHQVRFQLNILRLALNQYVDHLIRINK